MNEPRLNGVYSRNNLPNGIKKGAHAINLDEYENTGTHWIALFVEPKLQFILIVLVENIFLNKLINLLIMILKVIYLEYKHTIKLCADIFV